MPSLLNLPQWFLERDDSSELFKSTKTDLIHFFEKHGTDGTRYYVFYNTGKVMAINSEEVPPVPTPHNHVLFIYDKLKDVYYE